MSSRVTGVRSLADDLRSRTDGELAALLHARPDLAHPVPADLGALAQRAGGQASVAARLRAYDESQLQILLLCALAEGPVGVGLVSAAVVEASGGQVSTAEARRLVREALELFRRDALLWGSPRALHVTGAVRELLVPASTGPLIAGIDPVVAGYVRKPRSLAQLTGQMPPAAEAALRRLLDRPVVGVVADPRRTPDPNRSGVDWLLAHHLVVPLGTDRVVVPGEVVALVGQHEQGAAALRVPGLLPPVPARRIADPQRAESGAVGTAIDVLHAVDEIGHVWAEEPPGRLRAGGVSARDLTRTARAISATEAQTCLLLEVAAGAGLLANDNRDRATVLPTSAFDAWRAQPPPVRMARLLLAWRDLPRRIGTAAGESARPLSDDLVAPHLPALRAQVLAALAGDEDGTWSQAELLEALRWAAPRLDWVAREPDVLDILAQLSALGVLVGGWLTAAGHALAIPDTTATSSPTPGPAAGRGEPRPDHGLAAVTATLERSLPPEVDAVILQGDLTAIVPGLPAPGLADLLRRTARAESRGAASVYRFSGPSLRAALDDGATAAELLTALGSYGPVPQPLAYLITDTARTHATLRVGAAATFLRCEDAALLAAILADPRAAGLGLFALSETVAATGSPPEQTIEQLRSLGHHPLIDPGRGLSVPSVRRARTRSTAEPASSDTPAALANAAVRVMRAAGSPGSSAPTPPVEAAADPKGARGTRRGRSEQMGAAEPTPIERLLDDLHRAIRQERPVLLDYASATGVSTTVHVQPLQLVRGYLTGLDLLSQSIETYSVPRIRALHPIDALG